MYYSYLKKINNSNVHNMIKENGGEKWIIIIIIIMILNRMMNYKDKNIDDKK